MVDDNDQNDKNNGISRLFCMFQKRGYTPLPKMQKPLENGL